MFVSALNTEDVSRTRGGKKPFKIRRIVYIITAIIVILYLVSAVFVSLSNNVSTVVASNGSISESFRTSGYVLREQQVINAPSDGFFECVVSEGDRVKSGQVVAFMFNTQPQPALIEQLRKTIKLIRAKSGGANGAVYLNGSPGSKNAVAERIRNMSDMRAERNLKIAREQKDEINLILGGSAEASDGNSHTIDKLNEELNSLKQQAGDCIEICAPSGGIFSSRIDNMEDELKMDRIDSITPSFIAELDKIDLTSSSSVSVGQPLCKIVNNYRWAYTTVVDEKKLNDIKEGRSVSLSFFDLSSTSIKGTITHISDAEGGKKAVVISTNKYVDGIYTSSRVNADVITISVDGIRIPIKCLHVLDGATGVYVIRLGVAKFVPVNVRYKNEQWAVVSAQEPKDSGAKLQIYDEVIVEGKNIADGKVVR